MSGVVALVVWIVIAVIALALFVWWWRAVHAKSKEQQAVEALKAATGVVERRSERRADYRDGMLPPADGSPG